VTPQHRKTSRRARIVASGALAFGLTAAGALLAPAHAESACDERNINLSGFPGIVDEPSLGDLWVGQRIGTTGNGFRVDVCADGPGASSAHYDVREYDEGQQYERGLPLDCVAPEPPSDCVVVVGVDSKGGAVNDGSQSHAFPAFTWECGIDGWRLGCWTAESPIGDDHRALHS
jgi:hypothetical protein